MGPSTPTPLDRRRFLQTAAGCLAAPYVHTAPAAPASHPNILFILTDDQRADYLGCAGHPVLRTPNIDALAARGSRFSHAYATSPLCTPSRTCYFLGQWERKHGVNFNSASSLHPDAFANSYHALLRKAGYFTGYVGKNHTPAGAGGYRSGYLERQFDYWYGNHNHTLFYPKDKHAIYRNSSYDTQPEVLLEGARNFLTPDDQFTGASEFLRRRPAGRPFCLTVCFNLPHSAGTGSMRQKPTDPELYRTAYRDQADQLKLPKTYIAAKDIRTPKIPREVYSGVFIPSYNYVKTPEAMREQQIRTCQTVTGIDNVVGALAGQLKELKLDRETVVIYSSDHGLFHGEHGLGGKALAYEESIRIPLIVYDPRLRSQKPAVEQFAVPADIAPTILDLCGQAPPSSMQGRSLVPLLRGERPRWREDVFCENLFTAQEYPRVEAVRTRDWKYIRYFRRIPAGATEPAPYAETLEASIRGEKPIYEELYHLAEDPCEEHNLAANRNHGRKLEEMRARCARAVREAKGGPGAPLTIPNG